MDKNILTKECHECKKILDIEKFRLIRYSNDKYCSINICNICEKIKSHEYGNTFKGFIIQLLGNAKLAARRRKSIGRKDAGIFSLTYDQIVHLYNQQNGLCYYSNIKMNMQPCSNWKCSIERLDDNKGYTIDNIALVCLEFNNKLKWTKDKMQDLIIKIMKQHDYKKLVEEINTNLSVKSIRSKKEERVYKTINNIKHWQCADCKKYFTMDKFRKNIKRCVPCQRIIKKRYLGTITGHLKGLLSHAKHHTIDRKNTISRNSNPNLKDEFNLTFGDALDILKRQRGLCYYSGIKMNYGSILDKNWVASLERIDATKGYNPKGAIQGSTAPAGYTKDNVCFICYEFNTTDNTANFRYSKDKIGSGNWSQNKFLYFLENLLKTKNKNIVSV